MEEELSSSSQRVVWPPVMSPCACTIERKPCGPEETVSIERFKASLSYVLQYGRDKEEEMIDLIIFKKLVPNIESVKLDWVYVPDVGFILFFRGKYGRMNSSWERFELSSIMESHSASAGALPQVLDNESGLLSSISEEDYSSAYLSKSELSHTGSETLSKSNDDETISNAPESLDDPPLLASNTGTAPAKNLSLEAVQDQLISRINEYRFGIPTSPDYAPGAPSTSRSYSSGSTDTSIISTQSQNNQLDPQYSFPVPITNPYFIPVVSNNSPILHSNIPVTFHEYPALLSLDAGHQLHPAMAQLEENNVLIAPTNPIETTNDNNLYSGGFQDNTVVDQLVQPGSEEFIYQHSLARNRQASNSANHDAALTSFLAGMDHAINPRTLTGNTTEPEAQEYYQAQAIGEENAPFHLSVPAGIPQGFEVQYLPGLIEPQMLQFDHSVQSGMQQRFNGQYLPGPIEPQWSQFDHSVQSAMQPGFNLQSFPGTIDPNVSQFDHSVPSDTQQGFNFQSLPGTINPNLLQFDHAMQLMAQEALQILPSVETIDHQYTTTTAGHEAELPDLFDNEGPEGYEENDEDDEDDEDDEYEEYEEDGEHEEYEEQEGYLYQY